jgi:hypothetical protein
VALTIASGLGYGPGITFTWIYGLRIGKRSSQATGLLGPAIQDRQRNRNRHGATTMNDLRQFLHETAAETRGAFSLSELNSRWVSLAWGRVRKTRYGSRPSFLKRMAIKGAVREALASGQGLCRSRCGECWRNSPTPSGYKRRPCPGCKDAQILINDSLAAAAEKSKSNGGMIYMFLCSDCHEIAMEVQHVKMAKRRREPRLKLDTLDGAGDQKAKTRPWSLSPWKVFDIFR